MAGNSHDDLGTTPQSTEQPSTEQPSTEPQSAEPQSTELQGTEPQNTAPHNKGSLEADAAKESAPERAVAPKRQKQAPAVIVAEGGEEEEETWTNQPSDATPSETEGSDDLDVEEEEEEAPPVTRKAIHTGRDVVCEELPLRAQRAKDRLRPYLAGALVIELSNSGEKFLFDWRGDEAKVSPFSGDVLLSSPENTGPSAVDCVISVSEHHLMAIRSGDLNPQVALLADKIKVKGKMSPAVYLFNLVAPRMRPQ